MLLLALTACGEEKDTSEEPSLEIAQEDTAEEIEEETE